MLLCKEVKTTCIRQAKTHIDCIALLSSVSCRVYCQFKVITLSLEVPCACHTGILEAM